MTDAPAQVAVTSERSRPAPLGSLVASARRLTRLTLPRVGGTTSSSWQEDAWELYDLVGEQRFLATTLAGRLSQAQLYVGTHGEEGSTGDPVHVEDKPEVSGVLDAIGDSDSARSQLLYRLGINLFVTGDGWLAGIPRYLLPASMRPEDAVVPPGVGSGEEIDPNSVPIDDLEWRMLSVSEVSSNAGGQVNLMLGQGDDEQIKCNPDQVFLIRVWRPHPRKYWEADSPTRSSLPVLRELVGLTMHVSAQVDSRLAGAGLLIIPQSAQRALRAAAGLPEEDQSDQFTDALMEAMLKPIQDRGSASALVPLCATVPDDAVNLFNFITFDKPLDTESRNLRDEAIRRLALGQDAPPELLLGTGGMNHWGAWLVQEDVVTTHLEPPLALICDALTTQYLWPVLIQQGMTAEEAQQYVIWYDVSDLIVRPNRSGDAISLYDRGVLSAEALRAATGFDESDAPQALTEQPPEVKLAIEMLTKAPSLAQDPGLVSLVDGLRQVLYSPDSSTADSEVDVPPAAPADGDTTPPSGGQLPATDQAPAEPRAASGAPRIEVTSNGPALVWEVPNGALTAAR